MTGPTAHSTPGEFTDDGWQHLEQMLASLRELSQTAPSESAFYASLMERVIEPLGLRGGVVWQRLATGSVQALCQQRPDLIDLIDNRDSQRFHLAIVEIVGRTRSALNVAARSTVQGIPNPTACTLFFAPVIQTTRCEFVLQFFSDARLASDTVSGLVAVLEAVALQASEFHRIALTRQLESQLSDTDQLQAFALRVHARLNLTTTAMTIANDALVVLHCERASVLKYEGNRARLLAVSGSDGYERRSALVRALEQLASVVAQSGELQYPETKELPPQVERALAEYIDAGHAQWLRIIPLARVIDEQVDQERSETCEIIGVLVLECFQKTDAIVADKFIALFARHAALALDNALLTQRWHWFRLTSNWLGEGVVRERGRAWRRIAAVGITVALLVIGLWPTTFQLAAEGRLNPRNRYDIFAPLTGVVTEIHIREGQQVAADTRLITLRSPALELQISELDGKRQATEAAISSARSLRQQNSATEVERARYAAEEEELKATLAGLASQYAILEQQRAALIIRSPHAGKVVTRDVVQRLSGRPVNLGELLVRIADLDAPWQLELDLPEYRLQTLLHAQQASKEPLAVQYLIAAAPRESHRATLETIGDVAQLDAHQQPIIPLIAAVAGETPSDARPQATVYAQIDCGYRPLAYVWLHDLWEAIKIRWWQ